MPSLQSNKFHVQSNPQCCTCVPCEFPTVCHLYQHTYLAHFPLRCNQESQMYVCGGMNVGGWVGGKRCISLTFCLPCPYHFEHFTFPHCLYLGQWHSPLALHTSEDAQHMHHMSNKWDTGYCEEHKGGLQRHTANGISVYNGTSV